MKRRPVLFAAAGAAAVALVAAACIMWEPAIAPIAAPAPSSFDRALTLEGARVVALGDCAVCHTARGGQPFAGGLPLVTPFGTIYSTNITPDAQTGIGSWSLEAFARAMRRGIARDGHQLYPAFPYIHFTNPPANALIFPLNFRPLVAFWNVLFLRPGETQHDPAQDEAWNRGRLLVDGLGHCAACHSPLNAIGGEKLGRAFDGGEVDNWEAPPLNRLAGGPVPWTKAQLATYLRTGVSGAHGAAAGPMLPVTLELATVPEADVDAIATYLMSLHKPAPAPTVMPVSAAVANPSAIARGAALFSGACAACHGTGAPMQSVGARPSLASSSALQAGTPRNAIQMMLQGVAWNGEDAMHYMPAFAQAFDDQQLADLAAYLRATYARQPPWAGVQDTVATLRKGNESR
ncbi:gluconate 2-dehydrogenase (acceptor) [Cupriavidus basilensis OR16]|uniref:Gluconate 2-dehydrogenase (Acceptor) n=1 Tax=Cupriavidus basilensis OR16 TaxID=1127483 RepID=H1SER2_9BURK|nr:c-type cytochrome [Cupriavidus basilensis]EHP38988.1 gluconate 2-dehydrogenase (acceptor) [Cupriavidus basilensis OR16]